LSIKSKESTLLHFELCLHTESEDVLSFKIAFLGVFEFGKSAFSALLVFDKPESTPELCPLEPLEV
jgi:hypothetical protein